MSVPLVDIRDISFPSLYNDWLIFFSDFISKIFILVRFVDVPKTSVNKFSSTKKNNEISRKLFSV